MTISTLITVLLACTDVESETNLQNAGEPTEAVSSKSEKSSKEGTTKDDKVARKGLVAAPTDVAAPPEDSIKTESGLAYKVLTSGKDGEKPTADSKVTVHYTGWITDGEMFDSSVMRGRPAIFGLNQVIAGWTEGLQLMNIGDKVRFWIPEDIAYKGAKGKPEGMLVFDVELIEIQNPAPAPENVEAPPSNAAKTASGLSYVLLNKGEGTEHPTIDSKVKVHYTGWTTDGKMFDSSEMRGRAAEFGLGDVISGWTEGVQLMKKGDKMRFWIPQDLAYQGKQGAPEGMLVFDIELLDFQNPIPAPSDVSAAPSSAKVTETGLAYTVLTKGTGSEHPTAESKVTVHYTGWTTDGKMFDSSIMRNKPASFPLNKVIAGWTEGVQLMVVGEKTRFWIPENIAYKGRPGAPAGLLVFDVELLEIQ
jgi:peptidylprolyl isomerase